ncbi:MAG: ABC transporter ATP-binding protein [Acidimicrobiales bacterium]
MIRSARRRIGRPVEHPRRDVGVSCRGLEVGFDGVEVLRGLDLDVAPGRWLGIIGPNGAGKTTLLRALAGLVDHSGVVTVGSDAVSAGVLSPRARARLVGFVPQDPVVPPGLGVLDYVMLGRAPHQGFGFAATGEDERLVWAVLQRLELEGFADRTVDTLSGGERQRVVVARAVAQESPVLLLDEPTSSLDVGHQIEVLELLDEIRVERGLTIVTTMHDLDLAAQFAEEVVLIVDGRVAAVGDVATVMTEPILTRWFGAHVSVDSVDGEISIKVRRRRESRSDEAAIGEVRR